MSETTAVAVATETAHHATPGHPAAHGRCDDLDADARRTSP